MATRIAELITQKLLVSLVIEEGDRELYSYGFFLLITRFFFFLVTVVAGFLAGVPCESVLFFVVFMLLRTYAGGVHAKSETVCTVLTTLALTAAVFGIKLMKIAGNNLIPMLMLAIGSLCIFLLSPLDSKVKPLDVSEKKCCRKISLELTILCIVSAVISNILSFNTFNCVISSGIFLEGLLLSIGEMRNLHEGDNLKKYPLHFLNHFKNM